MPESTGTTTQTIHAGLDVIVERAGRFHYEASVELRHTSRHVSAVALTREDAIRDALAAACASPEVLGGLVLASRFDTP